jgi:DNA polymerase-3 subunit beta
MKKLIIAASLSIFALGVANAAPPAPKKEGIEGKDYKWNAQDGETTIQTAVKDVSIVQTGGVMLPYVKFHDVVRLADPEAVAAVDGNADAVHFLQGKNRFRLLTMPSARLETVLLRTSDFGFETTSENFAALVDKVSFAVDDNSLRAAADSVLVKMEGGVLTLVATDLRRMALAAAQVESPRDFAYIVPEGVLKIAALSAPKKAMLEVGFASDRHIRFASGDFVLQSLLVEGKFPPYDKITSRLPGLKSRDTASTSAAELVAACRQALLCYPDDSSTNVVRLTFGDNVIDVSTIDVGGKHRASIGVAATYSGPQREICVDPRYITNALQKGADPKKKIHVDHCGDRMPLVIRGKSFRYILMPVVPPSGR